MIDFELTMGDMNNKSRLPINQNHDHHYNNKKISIDSAVNDKIFIEQIQKNKRNSLDIQTPQFNHKYENYHKGILKNTTPMNNTRSNNPLTSTNK